MIERPQIDMARAFRWLLAPLLQNECVSIILEFSKAAYMVHPMHRRHLPLRGMLNTQE